MANNKYYAFHYVNLSDSGDYWNGVPNAAAAGNWGIARLDATALVAYRDESDPLPDVNFTVYDYGANGAAGFTTCPTNNTGTGNAHPNRWCRGQNVIFISYYYWNCNIFGGCGLQDDWWRRKLACHEFGHTVGLRHTNVEQWRNTSCMWWAANTGGSSIYRGAPDDHEVTHLNLYYQNR